MINRFKEVSFIPFKNSKIMPFYSDLGDVYFKLSDIPTIFDVNSNSIEKVYSKNISDIRKEKNLEDENNPYIHQDGIMKIADLLSLEYFIKCELGDWLKKISKNIDMEKTIIKIHTF